MRKNVLGVKVDILTQQESLDRLTEAIEKAPKGLTHVVTAYSEFFVRAWEDRVFKRLLNEADLVLADGVGPLAAISYSESIKAEDTTLERMGKGLLTGVKVLTGDVGETVSGVWIFDQVCQLAALRGWRVFLLGGFGEVVVKLRKQVEKEFPGIKVEADSGEREVGADENESKEIIKKINDFKAEILFVAYGPVKQEKWITENRNFLKAKVAIGVGGTFDELTGAVARCPKIFQRMGLKWFWRLVMEPSRFKRIFRAVVVFPWLVFKSSHLSLEKKGEPKKN